MSIIEHAQRVAEQIILAQEQRVKPKVEKHDYTFSDRLVITSPSAGFISKKKTIVPIDGELHKIVVRPDSVDDGDYFKVSAGSRKLIDKIYVYATTAASNELEEDESLKKGDVLTLEYVNNGSTTPKNIDITYHLIINS